MNYIELINNYWRKQEAHSIGTVAGYLYFHLLDVCNRQNWRNPFKRQNNKICGDLGITNPTLLKARNVLKQHGLIDFQSRGKGDTNVRYELLNNVKNYHTPYASSYHTALSTVYGLNNTDTEIPTHEVLHTVNHTGDKQPYFGKEKSCAQKESIIPDLPAVIALLQQQYASKWALCHRYGITDTPVKLHEKFELFWQMNVDEWRQKGMPELGSLMSHFLNWIPIHQAKINRPSPPSYSSGRKTGGQSPARGVKAVLTAFGNNTYKES